MNKLAKIIIRQWKESVAHPSTKEVQLVGITDESQSEADTEKSYQTAHGVSDCIEYYIFLYTQPMFMFIATLANVILFADQTFKKIFNNRAKGPSSSWIRAIEFICYLIIFVEILSSILHRLCKKLASKRAIKPRNTIIIFVDLIVQVLCIVFAHLNDVGYVYTYIFELFRLFRVFVFFHLISVSPGKRTLLYTLSKFGLIIFVVSHIAATLAAIISHEYANSKTRTWLKDLKTILKTDNISPIEYYIFCQFSVLAAIAALGCTPASPENDAETLLIVALMIIGLVFVNGVLLGSCTSIRIDIYRVKAIFYNKLKLINKNLNDGNIPKKIKFKINNYYMEFWAKEHATAKSRLFNQFPESIRKSVLLDKYWMTFNDSNFFPQTHNGFKRSLAFVMETIILTTGEVLYTQHAQKNTLMYIARGSIQLLSAEDMESSLVTLGDGTFIGEMNLICTTKNPVQIIASSYCVIHCLKKADLFRICARYRKLHQSQILHKQYQKIIRHAKECHLKKVSSTSLPFENLVRRKPPGNLNIKLLYVVSEEFTEKNREDEVFYKTKFPWILQANSRLIFYWDIIIVITILLVSIFMPIYIAFHEADTYLFYLSYHYVQLLYTIDLLIQIVVVTEDENGIHTKISEIFLVKLTSFRFLLDLVSAAPLYVILSLIKIDFLNPNKNLISFARLLKLHKVVWMFSKIENSFKFNIAALRLFKYIMYFLYLTFIFSIIYYMLACGNCTVYPENTWVRKLKEMHPETTRTQVYFNSFQASLLILILSGGGVIIYSNIIEVLCLFFFVICGMLICTYIASDYAATLTLQDYSRTQYSEKVMVIHKLSQSELMRTSENIKNLNRIYDYLLSQWRFIGGCSLKTLLNDAPPHLYDTHQIAKYSQAFEKLSPFFHLGQSFHNALATKAEIVFFSPNEIFVYANEPSTDMYILQKGYCELISCKNKRLDKIIGPGSDISLVEVLLGMNNLYFVRPITSVALLKVSQKDIIQVFRNYTSLEDFIINYRQDIKNSAIANKVFGNQEIRIAISDYHQETSSFYRFPNDKTNPLYRNLIRGWRKMIIFRYVMLPWTIMPEGRFIVTWEIIYNVSLFFLIILNLITDIYLWISPGIENFVYTLEVIQIVAIYLRFHICYYDQNGILITHPKSTAEHYLTGAFLVDLIAIIPMSRLYMAFNYESNQPLYYKAIFNVNKLLQLYRLPLIFYHFTKDELKPQGIMLNVLKFLPISAIYLTLCVAFMLAFSTYIIFEGNTIRMTTLPTSIVDYMTRLDYFEFNTYHPGDVYMLTLYWITATTMQLGFSGISPTRKIDVIASTAIELTGYLLFTYILVIIANSQTTINSQLTIHQSHMKHVVKFMKEEKVQKALQLKAIEYFEYRWQRHHGFTVTDIVNKCHHVLYEDFLYDQYKKIFIKVRIFTDLQNTIYRNLSLNLQRVYFLSDVPFIKLNDIVSKMYIVYSGEVNVFDSVKSLCATLSSGAIFGNIDNVTYTRSMLTYVSSGSIDLLEMDTKVFYSIMTPVVINKLQKHILLNNLSFITGISSRTAMATPKLHKKQKMVPLTRRQRKKLRILSSMALNMIFTLCSYGSICASLYLIAFYNEDHYILQTIPMYTLDLIHILIVIVKFLTPFYDAKGQFITSTKLIKKRLVRQPWFYINLFATIPLELVTFVPSLGFSQKNYIYRALLINRCLRFYNILKFFNEFNDMLNSDLLLMKLTSIFIYISLLLHAQTCILYVFATFGTNEFHKGSWAYQNGDFPICGNSYLCTLYVSTSILTMSGYHITIRTKLNVITVTIFVITDKILTAIFVAQLSACIQNYSSDLIAFDAKYVNLQVFLKRSFISKPLIRKIIAYTGQLWSKSKGVQEPILLSNAPLYLQEQIKTDIYGKHIYDNMVFAKCHIDFLRHLLKCLRIETYFINDTICEQGDINETMYFIHQGSIDVFYITDTEEIKVDELEELDCFGLIQGLYPRTPHTHTFRATTVTIVLTLKLPDWFFILHFFPASKYYIYNKLNSISSMNY